MTANQTFKFVVLNCPNTTLCVIVLFLMGTDIELFICLLSIDEPADSKLNAPVIATCPNIVLKAGISIADYC